MSPKSTAQVSFRRRADLMRALFDVLRNEHDGLRASDVIERLAKRMPPTEYESGEYASGAQRYEKIVRFSSIPLVKAGWLVKDSGRWIVTDAGRTAYAKYQDPERFLRTALGEYRAWKKAQWQKIAVDCQGSPTLTQLAITQCYAPGLLDLLGASPPDGVGGGGAAGGGVRSLSSSRSR